MPSNALWIGRDVPDDLARGVAFGLLENGVMLTYFGPFTYTDSKVNVIEIGYSVSNAERSTYVDVEDVIAVTNTKASSDRLSGYRVYVHRRSAVGNDYPGDETIRQKLEALGAEVVGFDDQADPFGPGVDYMRGASDAKQAAEALAMIVNEVIAPNDEPSEPLRARAQSSLPQADLLGLWF